MQTHTLTLTEGPLHSGISSVPVSSLSSPLGLLDGVSVSGRSLAGRSSCGVVWRSTSVVGA